MTRQSAVESQVEPLTLEDKQQHNDTLYKKLTNKNEDYVIKFIRQLESKDIAKDRQIHLLYQLLPGIIEGQQQHVPASKLYGTPTEALEQLLAPTDSPNSSEPSPLWLRYIDGSLLMAGVFMLISAISQYLGTRTQVGLVTLMVLLLLGGGAVIIISRYAPDQDNKGFFKYILVSTLVLSTLMLIYSMLETIIPRSYNILFDTPLAVTLGVVFLGAKWYLKQKCHITGNIM